MKPLRLVVADETPRFCGLIEAFEGIIDDPSVASRSAYGPNRLLCIYVDTEVAQMRIIFDPNQTCTHRQGVHTTLEIDEYELAEKLERAFDDGFDTIWIHG